MSSKKISDILEGRTKALNRTSVRASQRTSTFGTHRLKRRRAKAVHTIAEIVRPSIDASVKELYNIGDIQDSYFTDSTDESLLLEQESYGDSDFSLDFYGINVEKFGDDDLGQTIFETEEQSQDTLEEYDYLQQNPLEEQQHTLDDIAQLPSITDIVVTEEKEETKLIKRRKKKLSFDGNKGRFLEPLTGKELPTVVPSQTPLVATKAVQGKTDTTTKKDADSAAEDASKQKEQIIIEAKREDQSTEESEEETEEVDFSELFELDRKVALELAPLEIQAKDDEEILLTKITIKEEIVEPQPAEKVSLDELIRQEDERKLLESIDYFLNELIRRTVDYCEEVARETLLRNNLDKRKMMKELIQKLQSLEYDKKYYIFLEKKVVDHFSKKKAWKHLAPQTYIEMPEEIMRYTKCLEELDLVLGKEKETRRLARDGIDRAKVNLVNMKDRFVKSTQDFENLLWKILKRDDRDELKRAIVKCISVVRNEGLKLSKLRKFIIRRQHTLATFLHKLYKLTLVCGDIDFNDYEKLTTEIVSLNKKIEERNNDLKRMRGRLVIDMHFHAHIKEKKIMAKNLIAFHSSAYDELQEQCEDLKDELYDIGMERISLQERIRYLIEKGSLMHKTGLLHEYDTTIYKIAEKRQLVKELQIKLKELEDRYEKMKPFCRKKRL